MINSMKRFVFDLRKILFLKRLNSIISFNRLSSNDQNLFTESNLANLFSSYVQFCSRGHFSERAEAACWSGKMNHLDWYCFIGRLHDKENKSAKK